MQQINALEERLEQVMSVNKDKKKHKVEVDLTGFKMWLHQTEIKVLVFLILQLQHVQLLRQELPLPLML